MIFPPLPVHGFVELLGDVEAVDHRLGMGQQAPTGGVQGRPHVGPVGLHLPALVLGQLFQARLAGRLVPPLGHRQHLGPVGVGQVGQDRDVQLVPLLEAQLVDADIVDRPLGIDLLGPGVCELVADDPADRLRREAQPPGHVLLVAADERPQDVLLEAEGVADIAAFEGRDQVLAVAAEGAAVEGGLVGPEAGLPPDVEIAHHLDRVLGFDAGVLLMAAAVAKAALGPGPIDLEAVAVAVAVVAGDGHAWGQIDIDGDTGHDHPRQAGEAGGTAPDNVVRPALEKSLGSHLSTEEPTRTAT